VAAQGLALLGFSGWLLSRRTAELPSNQEVFEGSAVYLIICGLLVLLVALALRSLRGWGLAAGVVIQLIAVGVAYEMASAGQWIGAAVLGLSAAAVIASLMTRRSREALGRFS
jgi:CHASE2 domain-containing sensor protein